MEDSTYGRLEAIEKTPEKRSHRVLEKTDALTREIGGSYGEKNAEKEARQAGR